jgi:hypothetical protein
VRSTMRMVAASMAMAMNATTMVMTTRMMMI